MKVSRRAFLGTATLAAPFFISGRASAKTAPRRPAPSDRVSLGVIGCGTQAHANVPTFLQDKRVRISTVCDPVLSAGGYSYNSKAQGGREPFKGIVDRFYGDTSCRMAADWREVVYDPSIDAVLITAPDHWHATIAIAAMRAGKHVYCQKPMTLGVSEGREMVRVAKETGVTFQVGSQHRGNSAFRVAAEFVRNGMLGECRTCTVGLPGANGGMWGHGRDTARRRAPEYFSPASSWDMWLGPSKHWEDDAFIPGIHEPMCWRWNRRYGGGMITDFGAHEFDLLQQGLGMDRSGPVAIENFTAAEWQDDRAVFSWAGAFDFDFVYANGVRAHVTNMKPGVGRGVTFVGEKGTVSTVGGLQRPDHLRKWNEKRDLKDSEIHLYKPKDGHSHEMDFIDGIYENRPICTDCEIGHRTISAAHIANICERVGAKTLKWDPVAERFVGNEAANALLEVPYFNGYSLDA